MYHSKVVLLCWAVVFAAAILAALFKKRWAGLKDVLAGALVAAAGVGMSAVLENAVGALLLSLALLASAFFTLKGIVQILSPSKIRP